MAVSLSLDTVAHDMALYHRFAAEPRRTRHQVRALYSLFAFKSDERRFARALLRQKPNFWVFRCNQRRFCGDFIVVDMSCPQRERRKVWVVEMKERGTLELGGGGAGNQFVETDRTVRKVALETGAFAENACYQKVVGNLSHLLEYLGCSQAA